jgi:hypothetical protein
MSTSTGTLQPKVHIGAPLVWAAVALFAAATIAVYALTTTESGEETASSRTTVSGTAANTPTELRGGTVASAKAVRGEFIKAADAPVIRPVIRPFGRAGVIPRVGEITSIVNTPSELGTVISFSSATPAVTVRAKQLGLDLTAAAPSTAVRVTEARNAMLGSYLQAPIAVEIVEARNAMLGSYLQAPIPVEIVEARNAMLGSYQEGSGDEILVNGEPCVVCWKYR